TGRRVATADQQGNGEVPGHVEGVIAVQPFHRGRRHVGKGKELGIDSANALVDAPAAGAAARPDAERLAEVGPDEVDAVGAGGVEEVEYGGGVHRFPGHVDGGQAERHSAVLVHGALDVVLPDVLAERDPEVVVPGGAVHAEGVRGEGVRLLEVQHDVDVFDAR